jgi:hypothetical protein
VWFRNFTTDFVGKIWIGVQERMFRIYGSERQKWQDDGRCVMTGFFLSS